MNIHDHIIELLNISRNELISGERLVEETGYVNVKGDHTIGMDTRLENLFIEYIQKNKITADVFSEEIGTVKYQGKADYLIAFDPLDGSTNYKEGMGMLPYGSLFAVYQGDNPTLSDIVAAGAFEATQDIRWLFDGKTTTNLNTGKIVELSDVVQVDKKTSVYIDLYYQEAVQKYAQAAGKIHLRWNGSNISSLLYVLTGIAPVMGAIGMRAEEIGAMVGLITGAGGVVKKTDGSELLNDLFDVDGKYPLLAGVGNAVKQLVLE